MIIIGAGGFAKQLIDVLCDSFPRTAMHFYDDTEDSQASFLNKFDVLKTPSTAMERLSQDPSFVLGLSGPRNREMMANKFLAMGGELTSVVSSHARISNFDSTLGKGVTILSQVVIESSVGIGTGSLLNLNCLVTHDSEVGEFCEFGPGVIICGHAKIGNKVFIGAGAIVLPHVSIGDNAVIGAGAVVNRNVEAGQKVMGIPAK